MTLRLHSLAGLAQNVSERSAWRGLFTRASSLIEPLLPLKATVAHAALLTQQAIDGPAASGGSSSSGNAIVPATAYLARAEPPAKKAKNGEETVGGAARKDIMHFFSGAKR